MAQVLRELLFVKRDRLGPGVAVGVNPFDLVAGAPGRCYVWDEAGADPIPAWLLAPPLKRARRPGQLFAVVEPADWPDDAIAEPATVRLEGGALRDDLTRWLERAGQGSNADRSFYLGLFIPTRRVFYLLALSPSFSIYF